MFVPLFHGTRAISQQGLAGRRRDARGVGDEDVGGWTREDWASAVSSVYSHMAQCPSSTM